MLMLSPRAVIQGESGPDGQRGENGEPVSLSLSLSLSGIHNLAVANLLQCTNP